MNVIIFPDNGFGKPDELYQDEYNVCVGLGLKTFLISFRNTTLGQNPLVSKSNFDTPITGIYRGWMLTAPQYLFLYNSLLQRNIQLVNSPDQYEFAHHLPNNYSLLEGHTPKTTFKPLVGKYRYRHFKEQVEAFNGGSIIIKDWVKSQKHYWNEACYIPNSKNWKSTQKVIKRFIELQGQDLIGGLVFREFVKLEHLGNHPESGMPLTTEFRFFIYKGSVIAKMNYWDEVSYQELNPPIDKFQSIIQKANSNFFTVDIAKKVDGEWIIVEIGDGGVSGLPESQDKDSFYKNFV